MSSFMKQFISKESLEGVVEEVGEITPEEEVELVEATAEAEFVRRDVEQAVEASDRVAAVQEELQAQNEVAEGIMEANGGQLPMEAAAGIEAGRRAAAVALGVDPESEEGQAIVDQPQIDAMVRGEALPATEDDNKSKGLIATIMKIWDYIVSKAKQFKNWIVKAFSITPKKSKATYAKLKALTDEEFKKGLDFIKSDKDNAEKYGKLFVDGKLANMVEAGDTARTSVDVLFKLVKDNIRPALDILNSNTDESAKAKSAEELSSKLIESVGSSLDNLKPLKCNGEELKLVAEGGTIKVNKTQFDGGIGNITLKDALAAIEVNPLQVSLKKLYTSLSTFELKDLTTVADAAKKDGTLSASRVSNFFKGVVLSQQSISSSFNIALNKTLSFLDIVAAAGKKSNTEESGEIKALPYNG